MSVMTSCRGHKFNNLDKYFVIIINFQAAILCNFVRNLTTILLAMGKIPMKSIEYSGLTIDSPPLLRCILYFI